MCQLWGLRLSGRLQNASSRRAVYDPDQGVSELPAADGRVVQFLPSLHLSLQVLDFQCRLWESSHCVR